MICALLEWSSGRRTSIKFNHAMFAEIYSNLLNAIAKLEEDPYNCMKMAETREQWAHEGMYMKYDF